MGRPLIVSGQAVSVISASAVYDGALSRAPRLLLPYNGECFGWGLGLLNVLEVAALHTTQVFPKDILAQIQVASAFRTDFELDHHNSPLH